MRGATFRGLLRRLIVVNFNSRTSCEVRLLCCRSRPRESSISTHAPLARCDNRVVQIILRIAFQLTHLLRGATWIVVRFCSSVVFQLTHLLRGATWPGSRRMAHIHFNSRTSCEVRHRRRCCRLFTYGISTHAPLARCDPSTHASMISSAHFNSRTSCEVRRRIRILQ